MALAQETTDPWLESLRGAAGTVIGDLKPRFGESEAAGGGEQPAAETGGETGAPGGVAAVDPADPTVAGLIREWIDTAEPPPNATEGAHFHYTYRGNMVGTTADGGIIESPHETGAFDPVFLWVNRRALDSVDHCTMEEYVLARSRQESIAWCRGRYERSPAVAGAPRPEQTARDNELAAELRGPWKFGRVGGAFLCDITLTDQSGAHGRVIRACHPNESFWRVEGGELVFLDNKGRLTSRLTRRDANSWEGPYVLEPNRKITHYIRREAPLDTVAQALVGPWKFGRVGGAFLCDITLTDQSGAHGRVIRACHPNESFWRMEGDELVFLDNAGRLTSRLSRRDVNNWEGPYVLEPNRKITHYIRRALKPDEMAEAQRRCKAAYGAAAFAYVDDESVLRCDCSEGYQWNTARNGCVQATAAKQGEPDRGGEREPGADRKGSESYFVGTWALNAEACRGQAPQSKSDRTGQPATVGDAVVQGIEEGIEQAVARLGFDFRADGSFSIVDLVSGKREPGGRWSDREGVLATRPDDPSMEGGKARVLERHPDVATLEDMKTGEKFTLRRCGGTPN